MKKFTFLFVSFVVLFSSVVYLTFTISEHLSNYHAKKMEIAETLNFENRLMNAWEWVPFNTIGEEKVIIWQKLEIESDSLYQEALMMGAVLGGVVLLFTFSNMLYYRRRDHKMQIYGLVMVFSALSFLYLGLQSPFLEIEAYNKDLAFKIPLDIDASAIIKSYQENISEDLPFGISLSDIPYVSQQGQFHYDLDQTFEGRMYYFYQNKSVLELIKLLYTGGNFLVAICVIFFSIVFPLSKLFSSMIIFLNPGSKTSHKLAPAVIYLGKWSMADVFISAMFLAVFSFTNMNEGVETGSTTLIGMYFFLAFAILSIFSGIALKKLVHKKQNSVLDFI
ncbi:MAG: paraquat-inducible protein A [Crocinitomicaceae bacterium]|nr:paraquat-inducible protein A [Crocinitomicaceae bacterium]